MTDIKVVIFDLDDTLAPSKSPVPASVAAALIRLLDRVDVCIISGGALQQFQTQVMSSLPGTAELSRLHLMPTCGTQYYRWESGGWRQVYAETLDPDVTARIVAAMESAAADLGLNQAHSWGPVIEDRDTQVTFSALGQRAPNPAKMRWDPDGAKRARLRDAVAAQLPDLEVRVGGSTSIDVTRLGVDKAYGVRKLQQQLRCTLAQMLFLGDRLDVNGNDYPVRAMGVACVAVSGWRETERRIAELLSGLSLTSGGATLPGRHPLHSQRPPGRPVRPPARPRPAL